MTILIQENIVQKYSISVFKIKLNYKKNKSSLIENLSKYMIKSGDKKEELSTNIDEILYGKQ